MTTPPELTEQHIDELLSEHVFPLDDTRTGPRSYCPECFACRPCEVKAALTMARELGKLRERIEAWGATRLLPGTPWIGREQAWKELRALLTGGTDNNG